MSLNPKKKRLRGAGYGRVSVRDKTLSDFPSTAAQAAGNRRYTKENIPECTSFLEFSEPGISGEEFNRPDLQRVLRLVKGSLIDFVVVPETSRLSRNFRDSLRIFELLLEHDVELHTHGGFIDLRDPKQFLDAMEDAVDDNRERLKTQERVRRKRRENVRAGRFGGGTTPLGLEPKGGGTGLKIDDVYGPLATEAFERIGAGERSSQIVADWTCRGIRTRLRIVHDREGHQRMAGGLPFRADNIEALIRNPLYRGVFRDPTTGEEFKSKHHEPLVSDELWARANEQLDQKRKAAALAAGDQSELRDRDKHDHLLKGLLVCGDCDLRMTPHRSGNLRSDPDDEFHDYYSCVRAQKDSANCGCTVRHIPARATDRTVVTFLGQAINHPDAVASMLGKAGAMQASKANELREQLKNLDHQIETIEVEIGNVLAAVKASGASALTDALRQSSEHAIGKKAELVAERQELQETLSALQRAVPTDASVVAALKRFDWLIRQLSPEKQRELVQLFLRKIVVHRVHSAEMPGRVYRLILYIDPANLLAAAGDGAPQPAPEEPRRRHRGKKHASHGTPVEIGVRFASWKDANAVEIIYPFRVAELRRLAPQQPTAQPGRAEEQAPHPVIRAFAWQRELEQDSALRPAHIARKAGRTAASVSQHLKLLKLDPEVLAHFRKEPLPAAVQAVSLRSLLALVKLPSEQQRRKFRSLIGGAKSRRTNAVA